MGQAAQLAPARNAIHYERRRPEETTLYRLVQEHAESFFAHVEAETGASLPEFVKEELTPFSNAAFSRTVFCGYAAGTAAMKSS